METLIQFIQASYKKSRKFHCRGKVQRQWPVITKLLQEAVSQQWEFDQSNIGDKMASSRKTGDIIDELERNHGEFHNEQVAE